jgi:hypothetical protein
MHTDFLDQSLEILNNEQVVIQPDKLKVIRYHQDI